MRNGKEMYLCEVFGHAKELWMEKKDIPLVLIEEYNTFGNIGHHTEVSKHQSIRGHQSQLSDYVNHLLHDVIR